MVSHDSETYGRAIEERKNRSRRAYSLIVNVVLPATSVIIALGTILIQAFSSDGEKARLWVLSGLAMFGVLCLGAALLIFLRSAASYRHLDVVFYLHHIVHILRNEAAVADKLDLDGENLEGHVKNGLRNVLDSLSAAFRQLTGHRCRTCVKLLSVPDEYKEKELIASELTDAGFAEPFCRDRITEELFLADCDESSPLTSNPRFAAFISDESSRFFLINDIDRDDEFRTDSRNKYARLPYRSVIIWPIRLPARVLANKNLPDEPKQRIFGFLIVDCIRKNAFRRERDFDVGAAAADAIYTFLSRAYSKLDQVSPDQQGEWASDHDQQTDEHMDRNPTQ